MKDIEKAYDKGVEDGRKQMLDEFMDAFYKKVSDDTRKQVDDTRKQIDETTERLIWGESLEPNKNFNGFEVLFNK